MNRPIASNRNLFNVVPLMGESGTMGKIEVPRNANSIVVSVKAGSLEVWFGDFVSATPPEVPHLYFGQTNRPEQVDLPDNVYVVSYALGGPDSPAIASIMLMGER